VSVVASDLAKFLKDSCLVFRGQGGRYIDDKRRRENAAEIDLFLPQTYFRFDR
jgi:hypothetical protein